MCGVNNNHLDENLAGKWLALYRHVPTGQEIIAARLFLDKNSVYREGKAYNACHCSAEHDWVFIKPLRLGGVG